MIKDLAQPIQVVLVFDNARSFSKQFKKLQTLVPKLQHTLADFGQWGVLQGLTAPDILTLGSKQSHVSIQRFDKPMGLEGFADVLANPLIVNTRPHLAKAITAHKRAILIQVGAGSVPGMAQALANSKLGDGFLAEMSDLLGNVADRGSFEQRLLIAQAVGCLLIKELMPSAVHWTQSQQAFEGSTFEKLASDGYNPLLYMGVFPFDAEELPDGSVKVGLRGLGSQHLLGKMVTCAPDTLNWVENYQIMLGFVAYCRSMGRLLGDNETFGTDAPDAYTYEVHHKNDIPQLPDGYIQLRRRLKNDPQRPALKTQTSSTAQLHAAAAGARNKLPPLAAQEPEVGATTVRAKAQVVRGALRRLRIGPILAGLALAYLVLAQLPAPDMLVSFVENR